MDEKITQLRKVLGDSTCTVALYGSGMMEEGGFISIKKQDKAYDIENRYGYGVEEMYTSALYDTRSERLSELYKKEMLHNAPRDTTSGPALVAMERTEEPQCAIDSNTYDKTLRGDCRYVINLHGNIYRNQCPRCKKKHPIGYTAGTKRAPVCRDYNVSIRPMTSLIGKMVDSQSIIRITERITKADTLLLLGTIPTSEMSCQYIQYFTG